MLRRTGNPLAATNGEQVWTADQFYGQNFNKTREEIISQRRTRGWFSSQPGGPARRYVQDPLSGAVIDMRHMLIIGRLGSEGVGDAVENLQWLMGKPSGRNPQDYFSNDLGDAFYNHYYDPSGNFGVQLNNFLYDPKFLYIRKIHYERNGIPFP